MSGTTAGNDARRFVEGSGLPATIGERISAVLDGGRLSARARLDVARELVAHFEDGLAAGRSAEELLAAFGQDTATARLIDRGKRAMAPDKGRGDSLPLQLVRDARYALRRLYQSPGFTLPAVLSLALGIGANTAIFSVVNGLLLQEPPFDNPDQLINLYEYTPEFPNNVFSYPDYRDFRDATPEIFSDVSAMMLQPIGQDTDAGVQTRIAELVSGNYFSLLGLEPGAGRLFGPQDGTTPGGHSVVVLGYAFWQTAFGGSADAIGETLRLNNAAYTVIGVAPESFKGQLRGIDPQLFLPIMMINQLQGNSENALEWRGNYGTFPRARLRPGVTIEQARQAPDNLAADLRVAYPDVWHDEDRFLLIPTRDVIIFPMYDGALAAGSWLLLGVVGLVLLIACANLASFLLARAIDRRKEIALRLALGAPRSAVVRQLLVETVLLSLIGGGAGLVLAYWTLATLGGANLPFPIPMSLQFEIDGVVLTFSLAVSVAAGLLFGLAPAIQATRPDVVSTLRDETAGSGGGGRLTLRNVLVVAQVAVSVVLLISAGLFLRSLQQVYALDPGFGRDPSAILTFSLPADRYDSDSGLALLEELRDRFAAIHGVESAGTTNNLHLSQTNTLFFDLNVDGVPPPAGRDAHTVDWASADDAFFETIGISVLDGRGFAPQDNADGDPVVIVSQTLARRFWPDEPAVGKTIRNRDGSELTVVGVASDTKVRTLGEPPRPFVYRPIAQRFGDGFTAVARTSRNPRTVVLEMLAVVRQLAPDLLIFENKTMDDHLAVVRFPAQITAFMFGLFAALALGLATIGLYGLVSYAQAQRAREVGIRMSLGADAGSVIRMLVASGMRLVMIGGAIGLLAALAAARLLSRLLFGVGTADPATFIGVALVLGAIALLAAWIPARRASRINPVEALRAE